MGPKNLLKNLIQGISEFDIGTDFDLFSGVLNPGESAQENHQPETDTKMQRMNLTTTITT